MRAAEFLARFGDVEPNGKPGEFLAHCSAHTDSNPSLVLFVNADGTANAHCRAGCSLRDIMGAVGITREQRENLTGLGEIDTATPAPRTLLSAEYRQKATADRESWATELLMHDEATDYLLERFGIDAFAAGAEWLATAGLGYRDGRVVFIAREADGTPAFVQGRAVADGAEPRWDGESNAGGSQWLSAGFVGTVRGSGPVIVCEGPSDALTASLAGADAVAVRGSEFAKWITDVSGAFAGRDVYAVGDHDDAGRKFVAAIAAALPQARTFIAPGGPKADLNDLYRASPEGFAAKLEELMAAAGDQEPTHPDHPADPPEDVAAPVNIAPTVVEHLRGEFLATDKSAWVRWDGKRWSYVVPEIVTAAIAGACKVEFRDRYRAELRKHIAVLDEIQKSGKGGDEMAAARQAADKRHGRTLGDIGRLQRVGTDPALFRLVRAALWVDLAMFDEQRDWLNVANGMVNLRTGEIRPHDPGFYFTRVTDVEYRADAAHADWDKALAAVPDDVQPWFQLRMGQAVTGYPPADATVPFMMGGGENGKSTVLDGITRALGEFSTMVPRDVLLSRGDSHPAKFMPFKGARFAYLEELPEGDYLDGNQLKAISGTGEIRAREMGQNWITFRPTHSLFVTTNYDTKVDAPDHGTWRRLLRVRFPFKFGTDKPRDATLAQRMRDGGDGRPEAVLAWLIAGARRWYESGMQEGAVPDSVKADTDEWRATANNAIRFFNERFEPDAGSCVPSAELFADFREWAQDHGLRSWGDQTFWSRATQHPWFVGGQAEKRFARPGRQYRVSSTDPVKYPADKRLMYVTGIRRADGGSATHPDDPGPFRQ